MSLHATSGPSGHRPRWVAVGLFSTFLGTTFAAAEEPRILFIAIDAVPFGTMLEASRRPENTYYQSLAGPVPLISTFPSTTSLALAAILAPAGVEASPGYEAKHYDWQKNRVAGGGLLSYKPFPWRAFFDWKVEGLLRKATSAIRPIKASRRDISQSLEAFLESDRNHFFVYYDTTDSAGHLRSPHGLLPILAELDSQLRRIAADNPKRPFRTVLFSDHGMAGGSPLRNVRKDVLKRLKASGFEPAKKLVHPHQVVFSPFGLVSSFAAFTHPGREAEVAATIVRAPGVDFCVFRDGSGWTVKAADGSGWIRRHPSNEELWSYESEGRDPLQLDEALSARIGQPWFSDSEVFAATRTAEYPDPLYRISRCFDLVENPASLVCSVDRGSMYGSRMTAIASRLSVGRLHWTHGSMHIEASLGFLMSDVEGWQPSGAVRFDQALTPFLD